MQKAHFKIDQKTYPRTVLYGELGEAVFKFYAYHNNWDFVHTVSFLNALISYRRVLRRYGKLDKWKVSRDLRRFVQNSESYHDFFWEHCVRPPKSGNPDLRYWSAKMGVPDFLVHRWDCQKNKGEFFFVEVKTEKSQLSKVQKEMIRILKEKFPVYVFRADLPENLEIEVYFESV